MASGRNLGTVDGMTERKMGWMTGIEPATPGATVQCSTD